MAYSEWSVYPKGEFLQFMQMFQVYSEHQVYLYKLRHSPCCLGIFTDYDRQFHENDRDTRSQSQISSIPSSNFRRI